MKRTINQLAPFLHSVSYLINEARKIPHMPLAAILTHTEHDIVQVMLTELLKPQSEDLSEPQLTTAELASIAFILGRIPSLTKEQLNTLADLMEQASTPHVS